MIWELARTTCSVIVSSCVLHGMKRGDYTNFVVADTHGTDAILTILEGDAAAEQQAGNPHGRHSSSCNRHSVLFKSAIHFQPSQSDANFCRGFIFSHTDLVKCSEGNGHAVLVAGEARNLQMAPTPDGELDVEKAAQRQRSCNLLGRSGTDNYPRLKPAVGRPGSIVVVGKGILLVVVPKL